MDKCTCGNEKECGNCEHVDDTMARTGAYGWCSLSGGKVMDDDSCKYFLCADCGED